MIRSLDIHQNLTETLSKWCIVSDDREPKRNGLGSLLSGGRIRSWGTSRCICEVRHETAVLVDIGFQSVGTKNRRGTLVSLDAVLLACGYVVSIGVGRTSNDDVGIGAEDTR